MKYSFKCEKLVRDRMPEIIKEQGGFPCVETLDRKSSIMALKEKLCEEAKEVLDADDRQQIIEELADLREVIDALAQKLCIDHTEIDTIKRQKKLKNGGFERSVFMKSVETTENSRASQYLSKYPYVIMR